MKLTRKQRAAFFAGEYQWLKFPVMVLAPCPAEVGDTYQLSQNFWIEVRAVSRSKDSSSYVVRYDLFDHRQRPMYMRRTPAIHKEDFEAIRAGFEHGMPADEPTAEVIKKAAQESAYTSNKDASFDHLQIVDDRASDHITKGARGRFERERRREILRREIRSCASMLQQIATEGVKDDINVAHLLDRIKGEIRDFEEANERAA